MSEELDKVKALYEQDKMRLEAEVARLKQKISDHQQHMNSELIKMSEKIGSVLRDARISAGNSHILQDLKADAQKLLKKVEGFAL